MTLKAAGLTELPCIISNCGIPPIPRIPRTISNISVKLFQVIRLINIIKFKLADIFKYID